MCQACGCGDRNVVPVALNERILSANDRAARHNREHFRDHQVSAINLMGSPGAGKTAVLEATARALGRTVKVGVLEGDVRGTLDADRLARFHAHVTQVNTDPGFGGECHLDANMVRPGLSGLPLDHLDLLIIENVGNLVCPAEFRVGEDRRVMVFSPTEGEDKPLKYPLMFRAAELVLINKIDLLPYLDFDMEKFLYNLDAVNPGAKKLQVSAKTGEGVEEWRDWLVSVTKGAAAPA